MGRAPAGGGKLQVTAAETHSPDQKRIPYTLRLGASRGSPAAPLSTGAAGAGRPPPPKKNKKQKKQQDPGQTMGN